MPLGWGNRGGGGIPLRGDPLPPRYTTTAIKRFGTADKRQAISDKRKPKTGADTGAKTETAIGCGYLNRSLSAMA